MQPAASPHLLSSGRIPISPSPGYSEHKEAQLRGQDDVSGRPVRLRLQIHPQQQVFSVSKAQGEPMVEPDGMAHDLGREPVAMIAGSSLHPDILADR